MSHTPGDQEPHCFADTQPTEVSLAGPGCSGLGPGMCSGGAETMCSGEVSAFSAWVESDRDSLSPCRMTLLMMWRVS